MGFKLEAFGLHVLCSKALYVVKRFFRGFIGFVGLYPDALGA